MSQALYRQYRPQRFDDVVGQEVAVRTLHNAIEQDRVAHAYLFTGTKGTGKTTLAKLLAKAMNCEQGPTVDPCGTCDACVAIAESRSMDVVEMDAASNRGIDVIREKIIATVAFQPSEGTRRVYVLDESHMLTPEAFNALLKTIEEPPPHALFIFCTTDAHKMPATVRDRCQRLTMRSPSPETIVGVLQRVCADEGIDADEAALRAVARASQGSFRNSLGTLEMLTTTFGGSFTHAQVLEHLGVVSEDTLFEMADAVVQGDAGSVLRIVERLVQEGVDLEQFARALAEHLRSVLLQLNGVGELAAVADTARLQAQAGVADERRVLAAIDCIADSTTRIRVGADVRIAVETGLVRACHGLGLPLLAMRLAALEQREQGSYGAPLGAATAAAPRPAAAAPEAPAVPARAAAPSTEAAELAKAMKPAAKAPAAAPPPAASPTVAELDDAALADVAAWWPRVVQQLAGSPAFGAALQQLTAESADAEHIALRPAGTVLVTPKLKEAITAAVGTVTGRRLAVEVLEPTAARAAAPAAPPAPAPPARAAAQAPAPSTIAPVTAPSTPADAASDDEGVANLMSMFDATPVTDGDEQSGER